MKKEDKGCDLYICYMECFSEEPVCNDCPFIGYTKEQIPPHIIMEEE